MHYGHGIWLTATALLLHGWAQAAEPSDADAAKYRACVAAVKKSPDDGFETAIAWQSLGGGAPAEHCAALALLALGHHAEAAHRFEALARSVDADKAVKADLLDQAGQAWLLANSPVNAGRLFDAAIALKPDDPGLLTDRSQAHAASGDLKSALADLDAALAIDPYYVDALVFRGSARRQLGRTDDAAADIAEALTRDPGNPDALLERGMLRRLLGDEPGARRDWVRVIEAAPKSAAADTARANIERMDGPDRKTAKPSR